jgi:hypothetical protein
MSLFDDFLRTLKKDLLEVARNFSEDIREELLNDGEAFAIILQHDLERWTKQLAKGILSRDEFSYLVEAKKDLAEMEALKQKGLAQAKVDKLKVALIDSVVGSVFNVLG